MFATVTVILVVGVAYAFIKVRRQRKTASH